MALFPPGCLSIHHPRAWDFVSAKHASEIYCVAPFLAKCHLQVLAFVFLLFFSLRRKNPFSPQGSHLCTQERWSEYELMFFCLPRRSLLSLPILSSLYDSAI